MVNYMSQRETKLPMMCQLIRGLKLKLPYS